MTSRVKLLDPLLHTCDTHFVVVEPGSKASYWIHWKNGYSSFFSYGYFGKLKNQAILGGAGECMCPHCLRHRFIPYQPDPTYALNLVSLHCTDIASVEAQDAAASSLTLAAHV